MRFIYDGVEARIPSGFKQDDETITELVIPEGVTYIGDSAFKDCASLSLITIGKDVLGVGAGAFEGVAKMVDIIWLTDLPYQSAFARFLPRYEEIGSLAAPLRPFPHNDSEEQIVLTLGYLKHPELRSMYLPDVQMEYEAYIAEDFSKHLNLAMAHMDIKTIDQYIERENITPSEDLSHEDKLLRKIRSRVSTESMIRVLSEVGISLDMLPPVYYSDAEIILNPKDVAAPEILAYIIYSYIMIWPNIDHIPTELHRLKEVDDMALCLDRGSLQKALEKLLPEAVPLETYGKEMVIEHPNRMIPFLRFGTDDQLRDYMNRTDFYYNEAIYGKSGKQTLTILNKSALLSDTLVAALYAEEVDEMRAYVALRHTTEEDVRRDLLDYYYELETTGKVTRETMDPVEERTTVLTNMGHKLKSDWRHGVTYTYARMQDIFLGNPWIEDLISGLFYRRVSGGPAFRILDEEVRKSLDYDDEITLFHPVDGNEEDLRELEKRIEREGLKPIFNQIYVPVFRPDFAFNDEIRGRYEGIEVNLHVLKRLENYDFAITGDPQDAVKLEFDGKTIAVVKPAWFVNRQSWTPDMDEDQTDPRMHFGPMRNADLNNREMLDVISAIDEVLAFEMVKLQRLPVAPFMHLFSKEQIEELLDSSIESGKQEDTAVLLEHKQGNVADSGNTDLNSDLLLGF